MTKGKFAASRSAKCQHLLAEAIGLHQKGELAQAEELYRKLLSLDPRFHDARHFLGILRFQQGQHDEALSLIDEALQGKPDYPDALYNRGNILAALNRFDEALASYDQALTVGPGNPVTHNNRANALFELQRFEQALQGYRQALAIAPRYAEALDGLGNALLALRRPLEALASFDAALAVRPDIAAVYNNRGNAFRALDKLDDALASYERASAIAPKFVDALTNRGAVLAQLKRHNEAIACYDAAAAIDKNNADAFAGAADSALNLCDWARVDRIAAELPARIAAGQLAITPFQMIGYCDDPNLQAQCSALYVKQRFPPESPIPIRERSPRRERLKIAYLSADFHRHATAYLIAELFELHDRTAFEIHGISFGKDDGSDIRRRIVAGCDRFHDVRNESDESVARRLNALEIDIAVDLKGYTNGARSAILSHRPCPVQVSFLGFPGTMATECIDYIIADATVAPLTHQQYFTEQIVQLPNSYQINDRKRRIAERVQTRQEQGLPEDAFVFCCFNNSYKIRTPVFAVWMRLLQAIPGSILWLLRDNDGAVRNLKREAANHGIDPARLIFAGRCELDEHLARHRLADLFLDTLPYNAHTTASDALWAGLPVLTCIGKSFAGRVGASLLTAAGLPAFIARDLQHYEVLALELVASASLLAEAREHLSADMNAIPLFDSNCFRRNLEKAFKTMWSIWLQDERPRSFLVDPD